MVGFIIGMAVSIGMRVGELVSFIIGMEVLIGVTVGELVVRLLGSYKLDILSSPT